MSSKIDALTPRDQERGTEVNLPAPKTPPYRSVLMWGMANGGLQWRSVAEVSTTPGSTTSGDRQS